MITLEFDLAEFKKKARQMGVFADDQLPYAISRTLNDTMFQDVRPQITGPTWASAFKVRNSGSGRAAFRVATSSKTSWSAGLDSTDRGRAMNIGVHATGGARPKPSAALAIPNQKGRVTLHGRGRKPWARQVDRMVEKRALRVINGRGIFVGEGGRLHAWYWFRPGARLSKRFRFEADFKRSTEAGLARRFPPNLQRAIDTSFR